MTVGFLAPIHRDGWRFVALFAGASLVLLWLVWPLGLIGLVATLWCAYFFRDPRRVTPVRDGLLVSPADGVVLPIVDSAPPPELEMGTAPLKRISIFMNLFDVHVNRAPCDGRVVKRAYRPGRFFDASLDKASEHNERLALRLALDDGAAGGRELALVQIAGLVARRILCWVDTGDSVRAGERFGLIRFGSRVDIFLPAGFVPLVIEGQRTVAGETVLADLRSQEPPRQGEVR